MTNENEPEDELLTFKDIEAAVRKELEALVAVLAHFDGFISEISKRRCCDEQGRSYDCVDEDLKQIIITRLLERIPRFKMK